MKLLCVTDLHGQQARLDTILQAAGAVDMILLGGDITHFGEPEDAEELVRRAQSSGVPVWTVAGNCNSVQIDQRLAELGVSLHGRGIYYRGVRLHGLSGMPAGGPGVYQFTEPELNELLRSGYAEIAGTGPHVVLSHPPPRGTRDRTHLFHHVGSSALRDFIQETHPALVLCGHIHEARGVEMLGSTLVMNCGPARAGYYGIAEVDDTGKVKVEVRLAWIPTV